MVDKDCMHHHANPIAATSAQNLNETVILVP
jgi:hypothetical protein